MILSASAQNGTQRIPTLELGQSQVELSLNTDHDTRKTSRTLAERNGFKMQRRTQVNVKVKVFCTHTHGANKCSFHTILRKIRAEEIVDNEWFVAETNLEHSGMPFGITDSALLNCSTQGHLPTAIE